MSYGERKAKREQEIEGLKEALTILSGEALLQVSALHAGLSATSVIAVLHSANTFLDKFGS